ncbi:hypothetical protein [Phnomibacter ginsenosidimutans]|uniref:Uncharacterized protein n=1 Tax=Phnomibacter ginsenosidimutans TaxID=2676868 RepID=A0A6I6GWH7_9BACT|nr:hypothetical protein [Phnomibacter ginsenosidimutans]QGW29469.1 hypothetical protein GLV81_16365 [Phnomibacter ginsenosidimutans]
METKKMSLATVAGKLSRAEMKNVMAGNSSFEDTGDETIECNDTCLTTADCPLDRKCTTGTCGGKSIKACFLY